MRRPAGRLGLLGVVLLLGACGDTAAGDGDGDGDGDTAGELAGRTFLSTEDVGIPGGGPLNLQFTDDGRLIASAGCNSANGPVDLGDGRLAGAGDLGMTEMGCPPEVMESDGWLMELLGKEPSWELSGDGTLVLTAGELVVSLTDRDVLEPPVELAGRQWDVDGLTDGQTASSVPVGIAPYLRIDGDALTGFTGCNELSGTVAVDGDTLTVTDLGMTDVACEDAVAYVEETVLAALDGAVRYSITGNRLSLEAPSGFGLQAVTAR